MRARLVKELEIDGGVRGISYVEGRFYIASPTAVYTLVDTKLATLMSSVEVLGLFGDHVLSSRKVLRVDGTRIALPPMLFVAPSEMVAVEDGVVVAYDSFKHPNSAAVVRVDASGNVLWQTSMAPPPTIAEGNPAKKREPWHMQPWAPQEWVIESGHLCRSGDRLFAVFSEMPRSGIGVGHGIDLQTGAIVYRTRSTSFGRLAPDATPGRFLVGLHGYAPCETWLVDEAGEVVRRWPSHGIVVPGDPLRILELDHVVSSPCHVATLLPDGRVERGPRLPSYWTSPVVVADDRRAVFWRDDTLLELAPDGQSIDPLLSTPKRGRTFVGSLAGEAPGRIVLSWSTTLDSGHERRLFVVDLER